MKLFISFLFLFLFSGNIYASDVVSKIEIKGNERIHTDMVKSYLSVKEGDVVDDSLLNTNLNILYNSGFFNNITLDIKDGVLSVVVQENPIIDAVAFEGNDEVKEEDLKKQLLTRSRGIYLPSVIKKDVENIKIMYKRLGFFKAVVDAKVIKKPDNKYDVVFEIFEGQKAFVKNIKINGNENFSNAQLRDVLMTKQYAWWKIMEMFDTYDEDRIMYDTELLRVFYVNNGFLDFESLSHNAKMDLTEKNFYVTYNISEGKRYKIGEVSIESEIPDLNTQILLPEILLVKDRWYGEDLADKSVSALVEKMGQDGFAFVKIDVEKKTNPETGVVDIVFSIKNSRKAFINKIDVKNNTRTYEEVIRRNLSLDEQDIFNVNNLKLSEQRLMGLDYFSNVSIVPQQVFGTPDKVDINVHVEEKSTGELSFGMGWSSINDGFIEFGIRENNFMGKGQTLGFTSTFSGLQNNFSLSFVEPYLFDKDLLGGVDVYYTQYNYSSTYGYDIDSVGLGFKLGWNYNDKLSHRVNISGKNERMTNIESDLPSDLQEGIGDYDVFDLGQTLSFRDQIIDYVNDTKAGYVFTLSNEYAGFGGDKSFVKNDFSAKQYFSFWDNEWMLGILMETGKIHALEGKVLSRSDRYLLGGDNLRGFDYGGVGARSKQNSSYSYGGDWVLNGTFQLSFPVGIPRKYKVSGYVFYDWGRLGGPGLENDSDVEYSNKIRTSIGYGFAWNSPIGAINLSWAKALEYESYDELQSFKFAIGSRF